jgi:hypothetical protein
MKGVKRFGMKGKLAPRYNGSFPFLEKCGPMSFKLDLLPSLAGIHNIFHVLQLKKCWKVPYDVVLSEVTPLEAELSYIEPPIKILYQKECLMRQKTIKFLKVQYINHCEEEAMWESEDFIRSCHPNFLPPP